jgi:hypothetical protein
MTVNVPGTGVKDDRREVAALRTTNQISPRLDLEKRHDPAVDAV